MFTRSYLIIFPLALSLLSGALATNPYLPAYVYRGDRRGPEEIKAEDGFKTRDEAAGNPPDQSITALDHASKAATPRSPWISTTADKLAPEKYGHISTGDYIYKISTIGIEESVKGI